MALTTLQLNIDNKPLETHIQNFIDSSNERIVAYLTKDIKARAPRYVPCDSEAVYRALQFIFNEAIAPGDKFCEWGSGLGAVTSLASIIGFDAIGIECEEELVNEATALADEFNLSSTFVCDDFVPNGFEYSSDGKGDASALTESSLLPSEQLGRDDIFQNEFEIDEFDIIYAFPWPGEQGLVSDLFDATASEDTLLVTYCQTGGVVVERKC